MLTRQFQRLSSVLGLERLETVRFKQILKQLQIKFIVFDD